MPRNICKWKHPEIFAEWHPTLNGKLAVTRLGLRSKRLCWWKCSKKKCGHSWRDTVFGRIRLGRGCPKCEERKKNTRVYDKFEIRKTWGEISKLEKELESNMQKLLLNESDLKKREKIKIIIASRRLLDKISELSLELRKSVSKQRAFDKAQKKQKEEKTKIIKQKKLKNKKHGKNNGNKKSPISSK